MANKTHARLPGDVVVELSGPRHQQKWWARGQYYEAPLLEYIRQRWQGGTFIDGGACIGNHTLYFARFCAEHVVSVEPVERNMTHLMRNVALSELGDKVTTVPAALGAQPGRGAMQRMGKYHGLHNLVPGDEVDVVTLDAVAELARYPVTLVKLDVQWSEIAALHGTERLLSEMSPALFIELVDAPDLEAADEFLARFGYVRGRCFGGRSSPVYEYTIKENG